MPKTDGVLTKRQQLPKLKAIPKKNIKQQIRIVVAVMITMKTADISETNALVYARARIVTERLNVKPKGSHTQKVPPWKKRLEKQIKELRGNLSKLQEWQKGVLKKKKEKDQLNRMYKVNQKGLSVATDEVRQRLVAVGKASAV